MYEQEAERVAEQVTRMPEPMEVSGITSDNHVQRSCSKCLGRRLPGENEVLQSKEVPGSPSEVTPRLESDIDAIKGGGQPLPESVRAFFELRFGHDFSDVRVHTDTKAALAAQAVNPRAFTIGSDMVFGNREYAPGTSGGHRLLAHELTHIVPTGRTAKLRSRSPLSSTTSSCASMRSGECLTKYILNSASCSTAGHLT
ncbi:MAG TPA: DUF4157 domain-containing protein [Candidatus Methanoperedenaceae archaeon]|nr:DUF4157 domain-containing protein [Candidatus Methanoperedenaceae archaeon]